MGTGPYGTVATVSNVTMTSQNLSSHILLYVDSMESPLKRYADNTGNGSWRRLATGYTTSYTYAEEFLGGYGFSDVLVINSRPMVGGGAVTFISNDTALWDSPVVSDSGGSYDRLLVILHSTISAQMMLDGALYYANVLWSYGAVL